MLVRPHREKGMTAMQAEKSNRMKTRDLVYCAVFAALIAVCAWISIPMTVPFTMQTFGVFATVGLLGGKRGSLSVLVYLLLGAVGLPVFAGFKGGIGALMGTTGGYIVGFLASALVMWGLERLWGRSPRALLASMVLGLLVCYVLGTVWFMAVYASTTGPVGVATVLGWCVFPFLIPDGVKIALAMLVSARLAKYLR